MEIVGVDNNCISEVLNIDIILGNYCNYKCWKETSISESDFYISNLIL